MADYKTPQWLLPNEKNLAYPAAGAETGSGLSEDRHSLYSMDFNSGDYISANNTFLNSSTEFSISFWAKLSNASLNIVLGDIITPYSHGFSFNWAGGYEYVSGTVGTIIVRCQNGSSSPIILFPFAGDTNWHHFAVTYKTGTRKLYVNGSLSATNASGPSSMPATLGNTFKIGIDNSGGSNVTNGKIDEVAIFNTELTANEVQALSTASAPANIMALNKKPIAYYPLGEQAQMGSANWSFPNGSLQSHAVSFDGSTDYIDLGDLSNITSNAITTSVSVWFKKDGNGNYILFDLKEGSSRVAIQSYLSNSLYIYINGVSYSVAVTVTNDKWHNIMLAFDGTGVSNADKLKLYFNGSNITGGTYSGTVPTSVGTFTSSMTSDIGRTPSAAYFDGEISNVAIWNSDESTNIDNIYNNGSPQSTYTATPTAWWKLNAANSSYVYPWSVSIGAGDPDFWSGDDGAYSYNGVFRWYDNGPSGSSFGETINLTFKKIEGAYTNIQPTSSGGSWNIASGVPPEIRFFYRIDGGAWNVFNTVQTGSLPGSSGSWTFTTPTGVSCNTSYELYAEGYGGSGTTAFISLDDLTITSDQGTLLTETFDQTNFTGAHNNVITLPPPDWTFVDSSGSNNGESDTLPTSALTPSDLQFESPYSNYSLDFDGTSNFINCGIDSVFDFGTADFTWSFWINYETHTNYAGIFYTGISTSTFRLKFQTSGQILFLQNADGDSQVADLGTDITGTGWHHIALVRNSGIITTFLDGLSVDTDSRAGNINQGGGNFLIGQNSGAYLNGKMDEVAIWSSALTQAQVIQVYNNGYPADLTSLSPTSWWRLGEDAYFVGNDITIPNQITGGPTGTGSGTQTAILVGDAPGSYANGSGTNLVVTDRIGDAPESTANSVSINMIPSNRISYPAGYIPTQVDNAFSMDFDGVDDYFDLGAGLNIFRYNINESYSVSLWYKATAAVGFNTIINLGANSYRFCLLSATLGRITFGAGNSSTVTVTYNWMPTAGAINDGQWHHICIVQDSSGGVPNLTAYVDGSSSGSGAGTTPAITQNNNRIGDGHYGGVEAGIDEVAIFDYALTARQIRQDIYEGTTAGGKTADLNNISNLTAPVAWYRMGD